MKQHIKWTLALTGTFLSLQAFAAAPNTSDPATFLGPSARAGLTGPLTDTSAYSFAGEAGFKNARLGGTFGWLILENHRLKVSGEYLFQNITYSFFAGTDKRWQSQGAMGADYQYDMSRFMPWHPQVGVNAYFANTASAALGTVAGTYMNNGLPTFYGDQQRIAGSNSSAISPNLTLHPWATGKVGAELNYDNLRFMPKYTRANNAVGFGGTFHLDQALTTNTEIGASAAVRQPFNTYEGHFAWNNVPAWGTWVFKILGAYTVGKHQLPSTYDVGVSADYYLDMCDSTSYANETKEAFMAWVAKPAVHVPEILSRPDDLVFVAN